MTHAAPAQATMDLWCEHGWLGGPSATDGVLLRIEGERITSVVGGVLAPPAGAVVLEGLTLPGFTNGHVRSPQRVLGRPSSAMQLAATIAELPEPSSLFHLAQAVYAELSLSGYTTVCEFITGATPDHIGALVRAASEAGVRIAVADAWTNGENAQDWVARVDPFAESAIRRTDIRFVAAADRLTASGVATMHDITVWAAQMGVPLHVQAEDVDQTMGVMKELERIGLLGHRGGCTMVPPAFGAADEFTALGQQRGFVMVDPSRHGSHHLDIAALRSSGGRLVMVNGVDAAADPFESLRSVARIACQGRRPSDLAPSELLRTLTADAAASIGWRDTGLLASGQLADLVTVSLRSPRFAGTDPDNLLAGALAVATRADITHVAVGGRLIVDRGRHILGDVREMLDRALAMAAAAPATIRQRA